MIMKTTVKNLGSALILLAMAFGLNATESGLFTAFNASAEEPLEVETWMLESNHFEANSLEIESFLETSMESTLELEDWMFETGQIGTNMAAFESMLFVENESALEMETWMTEERYFDAGIPQFYEMALVDIEPSLEMEDWMLEEENFISGEAEFVYNLRTVNEPALYVEQWMVDMEFFGIDLSKNSESTVVDIAVSNPDFSILVEAVSKAGLAEALSADGPFTVFAPTNEAFGKLFSQLGVSGIKELTADQLKPILTYHVVSGKIMSADLSNTSVGTLSDGKKLKIDVSNGVKINDSKVITADISGKNGVVHVIDKVLIPK